MFSAQLDLPHKYYIVRRFGSYMQNKKGKQLLCLIVRYLIMGQLGQKHVDTSVLYTVVVIKLCQFVVSNFNNFNV